MNSSPLLSSLLRRESSKVQWLLGELLINVPGVEWESCQGLRVCWGKGDYLNLLSPRLWLYEIPVVISISLTPNPRSWSVIVLTDKFPLSSLILRGSMKVPSLDPLLLLRYLPLPTPSLSSLPPVGPLNGSVTQHCFLTFFSLTLSLNSC